MRSLLRIMFRLLTYTSLLILLLAVYIWIAGSLDAIHFSRYHASRSHAGFVTTTHALATGGNLEIWSSHSDMTDAAGNSIAPPNDFRNQWELRFAPPDDRLIKLLDPPHPPAVLFGIGAFRAQASSDSQWNQGDKINYKNWGVTIPLPLIVFAFALLPIGRIALQALRRGRGKCIRCGAVTGRGVKCAGCGLPQRSLLKRLARVSFSVTAGVSLLVLLVTIRIWLVPWSLMPMVRHTTEWQTIYSGSFTNVERVRNIALMPATDGLFVEIGASLMYSTPRSATSPSLPAVIVTSMSAESDTPPFPNVINLSHFPLVFQ